MKFLYLLVVIMWTALSLNVATAATPSPKGAKAYFIEPVDGAKVTSPVSVKFGLSGMGVAPAGVDKANTGHHHLLVNVKKYSSSMVIGKDAQHIHLGGGQTETVVKLPKGKHTLQILLGDHQHIPHNPPVASKKITIWVQ